MWYTLKGGKGRERVIYLVEPGVNNSGYNQHVWKKKKRRKR